METAAVNKKHSLIIKDTTTVTGVKSVIAVGEKEVRLALENKRLTLTGSGFSAEKLSIEEGALVLTGEVLSLRYTSASEPKSVLKRLFR